MRTKIFILFIILLLSISNASSESYIINKLSGISFDFVNGNIKNKHESIRDEFILEHNNQKATLYTGVTTLNGVFLDKIEGQLSFYFKANMATWYISCYPSMQIAFVNVHSDASEYGGAKSLNLIGSCIKK